MQSLGMLLASFSQQLQRRSGAECPPRASSLRLLRLLRIIALLLLLFLLLLLLMLLLSLCLHV